MTASEKKSVKPKNPQARTPARRMKNLPRTPVRPKVITKHMTPHEAAQWLVNDYEARRNGG